MPRLARGEVLLVTLVLGYLWFTLINQLRVEWSVNAQYNYGWAVPFLCAILLWNRRAKAENKNQKSWLKSKESKAESRNQERKTRQSTGNRR